MRNKLLLSITLLCFACFGRVWAEEVTIGETTATSQFLPSNCYYNYSLTQQIFTANEIGTVGTITSVSFYCTSYDAERSFDIYLVNTDKSAFSSTTDWIAVTDADKVFSGSVTMLRNQWNTILLNTFFEYDGTHNLALIVDDNTGSYVSSYPSFNVHTSVSKALRIYDDYTDYDPMAPSSYTGTIMDVRNTIKLNFPTCLPFTNVRIVDLTYNSVTMTWDYNAGDLNEHFLQPSAYFNPEGINWSYPWQSEPLTWNNLNPDTDYTLGVRRYCSEDDQSEPVIMTIHMPPVPMTIPFSESFDATSIPDRWTRYTGLLNDVMNGTALQPTTYGWYFGTYNGAFNNTSHARLNIYGTSCKNWLVTPQVTMQNNCQLSFELALTKYSGTMQPIDPTQQADDRFVVLASTNNGISWTILREWNNTGSPYVYNNILATGEDVAIDLTDYQGTCLTIAFYGESIASGGDNNLHIDNVSIDYIPACQKPTNFHVSSIAGHSVVLSWDAPEGQNHWEVGYKTDDDPYYQWFTEPTENPYLFTGHPNHPLQPETHYTVKVHSLCDGSGSSTWSKEVEFTTSSACPVPTDVTVLNTTTHGFWASFTPGGDWQTSWEFAVTTENTAPTTSQSNTTDPEGFGWEDHPYVMAGTNYYLWVGIYCEEDNTYHWGEPAEFTTPYACSTKVYAQDVEIDDVQTHEVSLDWGGSPATAAQWQVCYTHYNMLPPESSMSNCSVIVDEPYATIDGLSPDLEYHFWIRALCDVWYGTPEWGEWSDMITVHTEVSCYPPTNVTVSDITNNTVTISWDPNPSTVVPVEYYEVNIESDDWGDPYVAYTNEPYLELDIEGWVDEGEVLSCTVYVHAYCGQMEGLSDASEIVGFLITDKESLTVNDGTTTNSYVPIHGLWCDEYSKSQFIIPAEDIEDMQYSEISWMTFYASNDFVDWGNAEFEVYMMELPCETEFANATLYDWYDMQLVRSEGSLYISDGLMVVDLWEPFYYTDGNLLIGFKQTVSGSYISSYWYGVNTTTNSALGGYEYSKGITLQQFLPKTTFVYEPIGNTVCSKPKNFTVERVNATTIQFGWMPGSDDQVLWEVAWGGENFDPDDNTTWISHTITEYNPGVVTDFTPDMTYNFAVRAVCDQSQGLYSNWTCPVSFFLETCPTPTNVTITNVTTTEATVNWEGDSNTWITLYRSEYDATTGFETQTLEGWTSEGDGAWTVGVGDYSSSTGPHSGNYNAKITHSAEGNETWLISPMMDLSNTHIAYLDFWYINRAWTGDIDELGVYYRIDGGDWHELFISNGAHGTWTNERINLALLTSHDNCQIGFKMTDNYGYGVGLDDIQISGYKYAGGYWAYSPAQAFTFTNLNPNTKYTFYMIPNCGDGVDGLGTGWMYFTTEEVTTVMQTIALSAGWNWVSTNVEITLSDLQDALVAALPGSNITIKAQNGSNTNYNGTRWRGTLNSIDVALMYKVEIPSSTEITLEGEPIDPAAHPITISGNGSVMWIGFPFSGSMSLSNAFVGFAVSGDQVKRQVGNAANFSNSWRPNFNLESGKGYIYKSSTSAGDRILIFPSSKK